jgi:hypothetical protein
VLSIAARTVGRRRPAVVVVGSSQPGYVVDAQVGSCAYVADQVTPTVVFKSSVDLDFHDRRGLHLQVGQRFVLVESP